VSSSKNGAGFLTVCCSADKITKGKEVVRGVAKGRKKRKAGVQKKKLPVKNNESLRQGSEKGSPSVRHGHKKNQKLGAERSLGTTEAGLGYQESLSSQKGRGSYKGGERGGVPEEKRS